MLSGRPSVPASSFKILLLPIGAGLAAWPSKVPTVFLLERWFAKRFPLSSIEDLMLFLEDPFVDELFKGASYLREGF